MTAGLEGKRLVVIGASAGIGRAVALRAAKAGAEIAVVARRREPLDELAKAAGGATVITADLGRPDDCARIGEEAAAALGAIDVVLFTAAIARLRTLRQLTAEEWMQTLATNLVGTNLAISGIVPHLSDRGLVAVASSESAGNPFYALGSYAASKSAVEDSMRAWRVEHPDARFVTLVVGTTVPTEFANNFEPDEMAAAFPIWAAQGNAPAEYMQVDEVADVVVGVFGALLPNRSVGMETVFLRSPAPATGDTGTMTATAQATGHGVD
jgi:NAD(P)-dependent dehydrogenase (short-subunit alcohol dehydrogenase family)